MYRDETTKVLEDCKNQIKSLSEDTIRNIGAIGEQLCIAKEAIVKDTGDGRAPGFVEWVKSNFGFSKSTGSRYMTAYRAKLTNLDLIWGHLGRDEEKNVAPAQPNGGNRGQSESDGASQKASEKQPKGGKRYSAEWTVHITLHVETTNSEVINLLSGCKEMEDTIVHGFEKFYGWCQICRAQIQSKGSALCEKCAKIGIEEREFVGQIAQA